MATSLQRLLILTIVFAIMLNLCSQLYSMANDTEIMGALNTQSGSQYNSSQDFIDKNLNTTSDTNQVYLDKSAGDVKYSGNYFITGLGKAFDSVRRVFGFIPIDNNSDWVTIRIISIIYIILALTYALIPLEIFLVIYSKKST